MAQSALQPNTEWTARFTHIPWVQRWNSLLQSPLFVVLVSLLTVFGNLFGLELAAYTVLVLLGIGVFLFGRDLLPVMSIVVSCYIMPGVHNNPGRSEASIFYPQNGGIYILILAGLAVACLVYRLVRDKELGGKAFLKRPRKLLPGMIVLGAGYLLSGAFSGRYFENGIYNLAFAFVQFLAVFLMYWIFSGAVRWDRVRSDYLAWVGLGAGLTVCCQVIGVYITNHVITERTIHTGLIATGWGNANNMGCMIAMMIPFAVDLSHRSKYGWVYSTVGVLMIGFTCFTCSRTSIMEAVLIYIVAMLFALRDPRRRKDLIIANSVLLALLVLLLIFHGPMSQLFTELIERGFNPRLRDVIYVDGMQVFQDNPIFGESFYPSVDSIYQFSNVAAMQTILPARWHNTVIQLLASGGVVSLACYTVHRVQTAKLFWRTRKSDGIYISLSIAALLVMSLLDCHFFNVGPVLFYSMALAFLENVKFNR